MHESVESVESGESGGSGESGERHGPVDAGADDGSEKRQLGPLGAEQRGEGEAGYRVGHAGHVVGQHGECW